MRMASVDTLVEMAERGLDYRYWYTDAHNNIKAWCNKYHVDMPRFVAILAITSPRVRVAENIRIAVGVVFDTLSRKLLPNVQTGLEWFEKTGEIRGPKTSAFYRAIMGDDSAVVLDTWMAKALKVDYAALLNNKSHFKKAEMRVRAAAKRLDISPAECQAAIWAAAVTDAGQTPGEIPTIDDILKDAAKE